MFFVTVILYLYLSYCVTLRALSYTRCNTAQSVMQVFLLVSHPASRCLNIQFICAHLSVHGCAGQKKRCVQAHSWPTQNLVQYFFIYLKRALVENVPLAGPQCVFTLLITHSDVQQHTNMPNIKRLKDYILKEYYCVGYINIKMSYMS